jgi:hypothetical protein
MSARYSVRGLIPPDDKWNKMFQIYSACAALEIAPPNEVLEFFEYRKNLKTIEALPFIKKQIPHIKGDDQESEIWYEIKVEDIPKDVKVVQFVISY